MTRYEVFFRAQPAYLFGLPDSSVELVVRSGATIQIHHTAPHQAFARHPEPVSQYRLPDESLRLTLRPPAQEISIEVEDNLLRVVLEADDPLTAQREARDLVSRVISAWSVASMAYLWFEFGGINKIVDGTIEGRLGTQETAHSINVGAWEPGFMQSALQGGAQLLGPADSRLEKAITYHTHALYLGHQVQGDRRLRNSVHLAGC